MNIIPENTPSNAVIQTLSDEAKRLETKGMFDEASYHWLAAAKLVADRPVKTQFDRQHEDYYKARATKCKTKHVLPCWFIGKGIGG